MASNNTKIIAVTGATGSQGGGVVNIMRNTPGWKVRAITRNPTSESAKKLAATGNSCEGDVEVVQASFDDQASLEAAFRGCHAVFAVTNWWEHLFSGKTQDEAGALEEEQGMKVARAAAANLATVENFLWSTCPGADRATGGAQKVPHMDYKANVDHRIRSELPELAARTTYMLFGYYPQNMFTFPMLKPSEFPAGSGNYIQMLPSGPNAAPLNAGDMSVNPGIWARQIVRSGSLAHGKYTNVGLEKWSLEKMLKVWSEVTGRKAVFLPCSLESYAELWGTAGYEFGLQLQFCEGRDAWEEKHEKLFVTARGLGIDEKEVRGFRAVMEKWKDMV